jgi:MFS family permease
MQSVTQSWLVFTMTHSALAVGLIVATQTAPILLFGPIGGTIADRFGKYRILFWTQALAGLQALILAILALTGQLRLWEIFAIAASLGFINTVDNPTRQTFIVEMVGRDQLINALTLNSVMVSLARAIGPAFAGVLIAVVGSGWCFLANAVSFACVLVALVAMRKHELTPTPRVAAIRGQLLEGFRYVSRTPSLRNALLMMAVIGTLSFEFEVSLPLMAGDAFRGDSVTYGFLTSSLGVGAVIGGLITAGRTHISARTLVNTAIFFGVVVLGATFAPTLLAEEFVLPLVGAGLVTLMAVMNSSLQLETTPEMRGRVMSLWNVANQGSTPIGGPIIGLIGATFGARSTLGVGGVAALIAGAAGLISYRRHERCTDDFRARDEH